MSLRLTMFTAISSCLYHYACGVKLWLSMWLYMAMCVGICMAISEYLYHHVYGAQLQCGWLYGNEWLSVWL